MKTGSISSLPQSIVKMRTIFENALYDAKDAYGPIASNPGPMFEIHEREAEKFVKNPCFTVYSPASEIIVTVSPLIGSNASTNITAISMKK